MTAENARLRQEYIAYRNALWALAVEVEAVRAQLSHLALYGGKAGYLTSQVDLLAARLRDALTAVALLYEEGIVLAGTCEHGVPRKDMPYSHYSMYHKEDHP